MKENKFEIGQKVRFIGDSENDAGEVLSLSFDGENWSYKISSKEVDHARKEIIEGVKICLEDELVEVELEVKEEE